MARPLSPNPSPKALAMRALRAKWGEAGRQRARARVKKWRAANLEREREKRRQYMAKQYAEYPEKIRTRNRAWRKANPDKLLENVRAWKKANPEKARVLAIRGTHAYRARKLAAVTEAIDYHAVALRTCGCCGICGEQVAQRFHYDHIRPLARGGSHTTGNIQLAHGRCNQAKCARYEMQEAA